MAKIFLFEVELEFELMLEHLVTCIKKIVEIHSVFELISSLKIRNNHLEFLASGNGGLMGRLDRP